MKLGSVGGIYPSEQQWKTAGLGFVIQKSFSALICNMNEVTIIFLLLFAPGLLQCFPVTTSQGGNRYVQHFFCKIPGCAANVTNVFCNEELLFSHTHIADCTGPPPPNTVCQHDGQAFVSIDTDGDCEFEGKTGYIKTERCTAHICAFIFATTSIPVIVKDHAKPEYIVGAVCGLLLLIVGVSLYFYKKRPNREQQLASDSVVTAPLRELENPEETSDRDTHGSPGLDDGSSPLSLSSQRDHGA